MLDFFYADGEELGIPLQTLQSKLYSKIAQLLQSYDKSLTEVQDEYEASLRDRRGGEKVFLLRLLRFRVEKDDALSVADRDAGRKWLDVQLEQRKKK